jgi:hypothetical protein
MKCAHTGDLQQRYPETEMYQKCQHSYYCELCGYEWDCTHEDCIGFPNRQEMSDELKNVLDELVREAEKLELY